MGNPGRASRGLAGSGTADPVQSLSGGVLQGSFAGVEFRHEAHDAVVGGAAVPAANGNGGGVAAWPEMSGQRGDKVLAYPDRGTDVVLSLARPSLKAGRVWLMWRARRTCVWRMNSVRAQSWQGCSLRTRGNQNVEIA